MVTVGIRRPPSYSSASRGGGVSCAKRLRSSALRRFLQRLNHHSSRATTTASAVTQTAGERRLFSLPAALEGAGRLGGGTWTEELGGGGVTATVTGGGSLAPPALTAGGV